MGDTGMGNCSTLAFPCLLVGCRCSISGCPCSCFGWPSGSACPNSLSLHAKVRYFDAAKVDDAWTWLREGVQPMQGP